VIPFSTEQHALKEAQRIAETEHVTTEVRNGTGQVVQRFWYSEKIHQLI